MRRLIEYIRQVFCEHIYEYSEDHHKVMEYKVIIRQGTVVSATCVLCGFHKSYYKYNPK